MEVSVNNKPPIQPKNNEDKVQSPWVEALQSFMKNKIALVGTGIVVFLYC